jgi:GH35 family endo-1,4-beta-xylanase
VVKVDGGAMLRLETLRRPERRQGFQVGVKVPARIAAGDVLQVRFEARSAAAPSGGTAELGVSLRPGRSRFSLPLNMPVELKAEWRTFEYAFSADRDYEPDQAELEFTPGSTPQVAEIRSLELRNYRRTKRVPELGSTRLPYPGQEPSAPWRKAADERIEKYRKGDLRVEVHDAAGRPVRNAEVAVRMKKHAFGFGTAVNGPVMFGTRISPEDQKMYRKLLMELFNKAVTENDLKWQWWESKENRPRTIQMVESLRDAGITMRGHCLIWPSWNNAGVPATQAARNNPEALAKVLLDHIREEAESMSGRVAEWDVLNEIYTNHDLADLLPKGSEAGWFRAARAADPKAKLYINDFNILEGDDLAHQDAYYETIRGLIDAGAPLDGIGLQCHFPARVTPIEDVERRLERFAGLGKALQVTEFDVDTNDELSQADYTRDLLTLAFAHPAMEGFLFWGFWEGSHWKPKDAMFRQDWSERPAARAYKDLVFGRWWTNANGRTGQSGEWRGRGFLGDYEIEAKAGGKARTVTARLGKGGGTVRVTLE